MAVTIAPTSKMKKERTFIDINGNQYDDIQKFKSRQSNGRNEAIEETIKAPKNNKTLARSKSTGEGKQEGDETNKTHEQLRVSKLDSALDSAIEKAAVKVLESNPELIQDAVADIIAKKLKSKMENI
jgi:hypothetical protein